MEKVFFSKDISMLSGLEIKNQTNISAQLQSWFAVYRSAVVRWLCNVAKKKTAIAFFSVCTVDNLEGSTAAARRQHQRPQQRAVKRRGVCCQSYYTFISRVAFLSLCSHACPSPIHQATICLGVAASRWTLAIRFASHDPHQSSSIQTASARFPASTSSRQPMWWPSQKEQILKTSDPCDLINSQ